MKRKSVIKPNNLLFFRRKVGKRTSHLTHHFILAKLLRFQGTFLEKFLVSGFGADAPTDNAHKKRGNAAVFYLSLYVGTDVPNLSSRGFL